MEKKKNRWQEIALTSSGIVLLTIGLLLVTGPWIKNTLISNYAYDYTRERFTANQMQNNQGITGEFNYEEVVPPSFIDVLAAISTDYSDHVIGQVTIKSLAMNLPILKGTTNANLLIGVGTMQENQVMGIGNYALIGHHMHDENLLFGPLLKIKEGAMVQINNQETLYTYQVQTTEIVSETDMSILADVGDNRLTLITCDVSSATKQRYVVVAKLVEKNNMTLNQSSSSNFTNKTKAEIKNIQEYHGVVSKSQLIYQKKEVIIDIVVILIASCCICGLVIKIKTKRG